MELLQYDCALIGRAGCAEAGERDFQDLGLLPCEDGRVGRLEGAVQLDVAGSSPKSTGQSGRPEARAGFPGCHLGAEFSLGNVTLCSRGPPLAE